jgi:hypothetical protein
MNKKETVIINSKDFWEKKIIELEAYQGTIKSFCKKNNFSTDSFSFYRWRKKIKSLPNKKSFQVSRFIPVQINEQIKKKQELPDSKWVASIILELIKGLS